MRFVMFYHSLESDWNHGNAHFLRGVVRALLARGHQVRVFEPRDGWSRTNLLRDHGPEAIEGFRRAYPTLHSERYDPATLDLDAAIGEADVVIVHEWSEHDLVARIGEYRAAHPLFLLLFHDTHHRSVTDTGSMAAYDLARYDGVLAFGDVIRDLYLSRRWTKQAWTWHEAADTSLFHPGSGGVFGADDEPKTPPDLDTPGGDLVWIGNWGDEERTAELDEFLLTPVRELGLRAVVYGVRYPEDAQRRLAAAGIEYRGWVPNYRVPELFARFTVTVHVPRRPYLESLPGVPTIRPFEALACGIPLVSARWKEAAGLFEPGRDFLVAADGAEMKRHLADLVANPGRRRQLAASGLRAIRGRHTCEHRVDELLAIVASARADVKMERAGATA